MILFDISKVRVEHIWLKSVSGVLGGSLTYLDTKRSTKDKEVLIKRKIPHDVARLFMKVNPVRQYMEPVLAAVAFYDDRVIALERYPISRMTREEYLNQNVNWVSFIERNLRAVADTVTGKYQYYTDGTYAYVFCERHMSDEKQVDFRHTNDINAAVANGRRVSTSGKFREVPVDAIKLSWLAMQDIDVARSRRVCLAYVANDGSFSVSPPIWKSLTSIGQRQINRANISNADIEDDYGDGSFSRISDDDQFDRIDQFLSVNLAFIIKAGKELTDIFGYDSIEPLNLPRMMLELRTVNLPNVALAVKTTYDTGLKFSHTNAWLLGLLRRVNTLESYMTIRSLLKYLSTKGVYRKNAFSNESLFLPGKGVDDIKLLDVKAARLKIQGS